MLSQINEIKWVDEKGSFTTIENQLLAFGFNTAKSEIFKLCSKHAEYISQLEGMVLSVMPEEMLDRLKEECLK